MSRYVKEKIKLLNELGINLNDSQLSHIVSLPNEIQVDNYAHDLIFGSNGSCPWCESALNNHSKYLGSTRGASL